VIRVIVDTDVAMILPPADETRGNARSHTAVVPADHHLDTLLRAVLARAISNCDRTLRRIQHQNSHNHPMINSMKGRRERAVGMTCL
jgi:hypothetical protein